MFWNRYTLSPCIVFSTRIVVRPDKIVECSRNKWWVILGATVPTSQKSCSSLFRREYRKNVWMRHVQHVPGLWTASWRSVWRTVRAQTTHFPSLQWNIPLLSDRRNTQALKSLRRLLSQPLKSGSHRSGLVHLLSWYWRRDGLFPILRPPTKYWRPPNKFPVFFVKETGRKHASVVERDLKFTS